MFNDNYKRRSGVFMVNFEHISHLLTHISTVSIVNFEQVNDSWVNTRILSSTSLTQT